MTNLRILYDNAADRALLAASSQAGALGPANLQREGKEKLAADILREVSRPLGYSVSSSKPRREVQDDDSEEPAARRKVEKNPVQRVLFSSFIIQ